MTLAQVLAATGLILLGIVTWACILATTALLLPRQAAKAETTLTGSPVACFFGGLGMAIVLIISLGLMNAPLPPVKFLGILMALGLAGIMTLGSAGVVRLLNKRIGQLNGDSGSFQSLMRGSLIYSFGLNMPVLGWLLFTPLAIIFSLGAGISGLFAAQQAMVPQVPQPFKHEYDVMENQGVK